MRIRPGTIVTFLCFSLMVYAVVAVLAVQRVMNITCRLGCSMSSPPTPSITDGPIYTSLLFGGLGFVSQYIAGIFVQRHRNNHNQCIKCAWPRTMDRPVCPQCGRRHTKPMVLESRFEVLCDSDRPRHAPR